MNYKSVFIISVLAISVFIAGTFGFSWWNNNKHKISTDNAYVRSSITTISSRVSGYIELVPALTNAKVYKDEILVIFDTETFAAELKASEAAVEVANAKISTINTDFSNLKEITDAKIYTINTEFNNIVEITDAKISTIETNFRNITARMELVKTNVDGVTSEAAALSSELELANQNLSRIERLYKKNSVSRSKYDQTVSSVETSRHNLNAANTRIKSEKKKLDVILTEKQKINAQKKELIANLETKKLKIDAKKQELMASLETEKLKIESQKKELLASLEKAEAKLELAKINLDSTKVISPIDGIIANRIAEPGVYVEDGWPLMAVVPIHDIWIIANFKETQVENIKVGQRVNITFDAFKHNPIIGKVHSIAPASSASFSLLPPQNASGNFVKVVQRIPIKITFKIPDDMMGRIVPGLSAYVSVETDSSKKEVKSSTKLSSR